MGTEIERKFLVRDSSWHREAFGTPIRQGYLSREPARTVRIRQSGEAAFITIKGAVSGISRAEFEYPLPAADAAPLLALCLPPLIDKTRYHLSHGGFLWEIDEFHGDNAGLIIAEIELPAPDTPFPAPPWLGPEVSHLPRYFNSRLATHPYQAWTTDEREER